MQREAVIRGPAVVSWNSLMLYTKDDITLTVEKNTWDVESAAFGKVDERLMSRQVRVTFTPVGKLIAGMWPYASTAIGGSIYGSSDKDITILPLSSTQLKYVIKNCAITKMPSIYLSTKKTLCGDIEFTGLGLEDTATSTADSLITTSAAASFSDTSFATSDIVSGPVSAAWGSILTSIDTEDGWQIDFSMKTTDVVSDKYGIIDKTLDDVGVVASCNPLLTSAASETALITALAYDVAIGATVRSAANLVLTGTGATVTLVEPSVKLWEPNFSANKNRLGKMTFTGQRKITTGALTAMWTIA